jgi:amidohydrolase
MAAADRFTLTVHGAGGHAARPHLAVDPVVVAAQIITALQTLVSREIDPADPAVLTIGSLTAGTTFNVIPDTATLKGTARSYNPAVRDLLERRLDEVAAGVAQAMRAQIRLEYERLYPPLVNHQSGVDLVGAVVTEVLGPEALVQRDLMMGAEDFSYLLERVPGAMFYLGVRGRDWAEPRPIHSASFDMDERALPVGAAVMTGVALRYLEGATA